MNIDGSIKTFAEFNNENCRNGYLYFNQKDDLRISVMPSKRILDTPWPLQKIPFKQTGLLMKKEYHSMRGNITVPSWRCDEFCT